MERKDLAIFQTIPVMAFIKDENGKYLWANPFYLEAVQRTAEEVIGRRDKDLYQIEDAETFLKDDRQVLAEDKALRTTEAVPRADGKKQVGRIVKFPVQFEGKKCLFGIAIIMD